MTSRLHTCECLVYLSLNCSSSLLCPFNDLPLPIGKGKSREGASIWSWWRPQLALQQCWQECLALIQYLLTSRHGPAWAFISTLLCHLRADASVATQKTSGSNTPRHITPHMRMRFSSLLVVFQHTHVKISMNALNTLDGLTCGIKGHLQLMTCLCNLLMQSWLYSENR